MCKIRHLASGFAAFVLMLAHLRPAAAANCGDVMIVLDRSAGMRGCLADGMPLDALVSDVLGPFLKERAIILPAGLITLPDAASCSGLGCDAALVVPVSDSGGRDIASWLAGPPSSVCGSAAIAAGLEAALSATWSSRPVHGVVLITASEPACTGGTAGALAAVQALNANGVHTWVIGLQATIGSCESPAKLFRPQTLNALALAGGRPDLRGSTSYYTASTAAELKAVLQRPIGELTSGTLDICLRPGDAGADGGAPTDAATETDGPQGDGSGGDSAASDGPGGGSLDGDGAAGTSPGGGDSACACNAGGPRSGRLPATVITTAISAAILTSRRRRHRCACSGRLTLSFSATGSPASRITQSGMLHVS